MTYFNQALKTLGVVGSCGIATAFLGTAAYGSVLGYNSYKKWEAESKVADPALKALKTNIDCIRSFNSNISSPEQPASTKLIGSGKAKLVYSGFRREENGTAQSIDSKIEGIAYIIPRSSSGQNELRLEIQDGQSIKNGVYLANLQLFLESLGEDKDRAKMSAAVLITQFPTIEDLIQGLEKKDRKLNLFFEKQSSVSLDLYTRSLQRLMESCLHLAVDLVDAPDIIIEGKPAIVTKMAETNLESAVRTTTYRFPQSADLALQLMKGFRELHASGYVHGDIKLENVLVYERAAQRNLGSSGPDQASYLERCEKFLFAPFRSGESPSSQEGVLQCNGNPILRIADWGKSKKLGSTEVKLHTGNLRHMAPERLCSQKGEVFGVAMMVVRMLEEEFLTDFPQQMLIEPDQKDIAKEKRLRDENDPEKCRKGIERFLSISQGCPEIDTQGFDVIHHAFASFMIFLHNSPQNIDSQLNKYLYALQTNLEEKYGDSEEKKIKVRDLISLLRSMTRSDKTERISMEEAVPRLEECLAPFREQAPH